MNINKNNSELLECILKELKVYINTNTRTNIQLYVEQPKIRYYMLRDDLLEIVLRQLWKQFNKSKSIVDTSNNTTKDVFVKEFLNIMVHHVNTNILKTSPRLRKRLHSHMIKLTVHSLFKELRDIRDGNMTHGPTVNFDKKQGWMVEYKQ